MQENEEKAKKPKKKKSNLNGTENKPFQYFLLQTKGYKKQFTDEDAARTAFRRKEKDALENGESFKITLSAKRNLSDSWTELDYVSVNA